MKIFLMLHFQSLNELSLSRSVLIVQKRTDLTQANANLLYFLHLFNELEFCCFLLILLFGTRTSIYGKWTSTGLLGMFLVVCDVHQLQRTLWFRM